MLDGAKNTMPDENKVTTDAEKAEDVEDTEGEPEGTPEGESEDESETKKNDDKGIDYDSEIEKERKGKPDPKKAQEAFRKRMEKRMPAESDEDSDDRPLTRREIQEMLAEERKQRQANDAFSIARSLSQSDKEAELIVTKWQNRSFPTHLSLEEQIAESYAITHSKKIIGERNELARALRGKSGANRDGAVAHRDGIQISKEPKLAPQDAEVIKASGFTFNQSTKQYEKKLPSGESLILDPKTKKTTYVRKLK